jgi:hypothetical protein
LFLDINANINANININININTNINININTNINMNDISVLICGIVKNVQEKIENNIELAIKTGSNFENYKIILYENNSTDNTKNILNKYKKNNKIVIISEDIIDLNKRENNTIWSYKAVTGSDHPCRIELISNARNKLLQEINKDKYNYFTHIIILDFDSNGWEIDGIIDSFSKKENWDAVFASSDRYYDYYALRCETKPFGPEIIGEHFWNNQNANFNINDNKLMPVYSAFNGIGIYKKNILNDIKYDFKINDNIKEYYKKYLTTHSVSEELTNHIKTPCLKFPGGIIDDNIYWKNNSGYDGVVVCEHVALNIALHNNGFKLFINPNMKYNWSG